MKTQYLNRRWSKKWMLFLFPLAVLFGLVACREELDPMKFETNELALTTSDINELLPGMFNSKFNFSWTTGNNMGTSSSISYTLELDKKGNNFANAQVYEKGKDVYTHDITIGELNTLLVETFAATPGAPIEMQARVTATFGDASITPQQSVVDLTLTPFKPFTSQLFMVGDAAPSGWDITNATELTRNASNPTEFVYYGNLNAGNFKFAVNNDSCWCQDFYTQDPNDAGKMIFNEGGSGTDLQWTIDNSGLYKITVNVLALTIKIEEMTGPQFSNIWIVGDASPSGWDVENPVAFTQDADNPFVFTLECQLNPGNFKLLAGSLGEWCENWYRPLVDNQGLTETGVEQNHGCDVDNRWLVTASTAGRYKITLNTSNNTIKFEPINIYIIGDATPNGWNMGSLEPMQKNGSVYTWTGQLNAGDLKFTKFNSDWCQGTELVAVTANQDISNTSFQERVKCAGGDATDFKWKVKASQAGTYTIKFDLNTNTLTIE